MRTTRRFPLLAAVAASSMLSAAAITASAAGAPTLPQPSAYNSLSGVSCLSASNCWAVGSAEDTNNNTTGEILHWTGSWVATSAPAATGALDSISCTSARSCWAVGNIGNGQTFPRPLTVRWNGSTWTKVGTPNVPKDVLSAVSCTSSANCWAVGNYARSNKTLALHWNGASWTHVATPNPSTKYGASLESVSCPSAKSCWALGYYYAAPLKPTVTAYIIAVHWNGSVWKVAWTSAPYLGADSSASVRLGVSCLSTHDCWVAGFSSLSPLDYHPILIHWSGRSWAPVKAPRFKAASLDAVNCSSTADCWAVGNVGTFSGGTHSLVLHWNGSQWGRAAAPSTKGSLADVSCTASTNCWAVGQQSANTAGLNLADHWSGSAWSSL
jgi:hypothetical protein